MLSHESATKVFTCPSEQLPGFGAFEFQCPETWVPDEAPDTLAVVYDAGSPPAFRVNVMVGAQRIDGKLDIAEVAREALLEMKGSFPDLEIVEERQIEVSREPAVYRIQRFAVIVTDPESSQDSSVMMMQWQVLLLAPSSPQRKTRDLFRLNATCRASDVGRYEVVFENLLASFKVGDLS